MLGLSSMNPIRSKLDARVYVLNVLAYKADVPNFRELLEQAEGYLLNGIDIPDVTKDELEGMGGLIDSMKNKIDGIPLSALALDSKQKESD